MPPDSSLVLSLFFTGLLFSGWISFLALCAYIVPASFRVRSDQVELFATKAEMEDGFGRFEKWLKDVESRLARWRGATAGREGRLELAREELQFQRIVAAQKELPQLRALMKTIKNDARLSTEEKFGRVLDLLHGPDRAKAEPKPGPGDPEQTGPEQPGNAEGEAA